MLSQFFLSSYGLPLKCFLLLLLLFWPHHTAWGILVSRPGTEPELPAVRVQRPRDWLTREVPLYSLSSAFKCTKCFPFDKFNLAHFFVCCLCFWCPLQKWLHSEFSVLKIFSCFLLRVVQLSLSNFLNCWHSNLLGKVLSSLLSGMRPTHEFLNPPSDCHVPLAVRCSGLKEEETEWTSLRSSP